MKKKLIVVGIALVVLIGVVFGIRALFFTAPPPSYLTVSVTRGNIEQAVQATGVLEPIQVVNVGAQVNGQLKSLKVKLGDRVKKGDLLAEIDPAIQENNLRNAEASLVSARAQKRASEAQLKQYELSLARQEKMVTSSASSQAELESARAQVESTKAQLDSLNAQINQAMIQVDTAKTNLGYTKILAPMDGEVISVVTQEGQTVVSSQSAPTILILANVDTMTVKAQISEADVVRIQPGLPVYFTILGKPGERHHSTLRTVEPAPDTYTSATQTTSSSSASAVYYNGLFDVANPDHVLRTKMTAQVSIVLGQAKDALTIPVTALGSKTRDGYRVQVLNNGLPEERDIKTGLNNNVQVEILEGLQEGDEVIAGAGAASVIRDTTRAPRMRM
jgi:macrolide-specific efflux system membrane fusion protein